MKHTIGLWRRAPFLRLFLGLATGIAVQAQWPLLPGFLCGALLASLAGMGMYASLPVRKKYGFRVLNGLLIHGLFFFLGALLIWRNDVRNRSAWIGHIPPGNMMEAVIEEPPVGKAHSWKAVAIISNAYGARANLPAEGRVLLYFEQQANVAPLHYGSRVLLQKPLQAIKDAGNPGGFDYRRYCLFQGITHQAYIKTGEYVVLPRRRSFSFHEWIIEGRQRIVGILRKCIQGRKEQGLAEALLIGYKNDLDQQLVQAYTNTGVVHIIAISGMHLALIYGLLVMLTRPLQARKWRLPRLLLLLSGLWLFSFLAGAQASVVRSTVMFSCIAVGELLERKTSVYNSLALSAFCLLCYDPFWLWDVGFQLSYAAVLSIVVFYRSVYRLLHWPNRMLDAVWKTMAVSLAAQILTTPLSLYHFHQFPVLFLLTNLVAVPLSSLVLLGEIAVCAFAWTGPPAMILGRITECLMRWMNGYIERLDHTSFAVWEGFSIDMMQTVLLLAMIGGLYVGAGAKKNTALFCSALALLLFIMLRSLSFLRSERQHKLIVYNIPRRLALDLVAGRSSCLIADTAVWQEPVDRFYLQPARTLLRVRQEQRRAAMAASFLFCGKRIELVMSAMPASVHGPPVEVLLLSGNAVGPLGALLRQGRISRVVLSAAVPRGKATLWKKDCAAMGVPFHDVAESGAFVMNL